MPQQPFLDRNHDVIGVHALAGRAIRSLRLHERRLGGLRTAHPDEVRARVAFPGAAIGDRYVELE